MSILDPEQPTESSYPEFVIVSSHSFGSHWLLLLLVQGPFGHHTQEFPRICTPFATTFLLSTVLRHVSRFLIVLHGAVWQESHRIISLIELGMTFFLSVGISPPPRLLGLGLGHFYVCFPIFLLWKYNWKWAKLSPPPTSGSGSLLRLFSNKFALEIQLKINKAFLPRLLGLGHFYVCFPI